MELQVKQRITGAIVLVVLVVIIVPALLTGPRHPPAAPPAQIGQPPLQTYRSELKTGSATSIPSNAESASPEVPRANADDTVAAVTAGASADTERDAAHEVETMPARPERPAAPVQSAKPAAAPPPKPAPAPSKPAASRASKPVAAPASKPAAAQAPSKAAAAGSGDWAVQLGSFSSHSNAQHLVSELKGQGFSAYVADGSRPGHPLFRVRCGPVRDRAAAEALLKRLKTKGHSGSVVTNP